MRQAPDVFPKDEHNAILVANVHPPDWKNPDPAPRYNLVVIGAGTAGLVSAAGAAVLGGRVALIEKHLLGGDCLNVGCVPSKCVIRSSRVVEEVRMGPALSVHIPEGTRADFPAVMERMRRLRARISHHDSVDRFQQFGADIFLGEGRFTARDTIEVDGKTLQFSKAVIATGTRAAVPPIPGLAEAGYLTNESIFSLTERPERLAVIGAGPIGCEMSQAFRRLGSEVWILEAESQMLTREDRDAAEIVQRAFIRDGVNLVLGCKILKVERRGTEKIIQLEGNGACTDLPVDEILVGVGRAPNVEGLNLEAAGVEYSTHGVQVNDYLQTTNSRIYAAGDICLPHKFTHIADATARIVIQNALFAGRKKFSSLIIPWCTYTDPEIAHVGMYERDALHKGIPVETFVRHLRDVDRAITDGEEEGFVKVHVKKGTDRILGATIVARHAGEMISEITLAMVGKIGLKTISNVIHPYPTQAEAIRQVADAYNRTRLTRGVKNLFTRWFAWTR